MNNKYYHADVPDTSPRQVNGLDRVARPASPNTSVPTSPKQGIWSSGSSVSSTGIGPGRQLANRKLQRKCRPLTKCLSCPGSGCALYDCREPTSVKCLIHQPAFARDAFIDFLPGCCTIILFTSLVHTALFGWVFGKRARDPA